jgi:hypothetical protein
MKIREFLIAFFLFLGITFLFFYPFFLRRYLPFPGDLLVGNYAPWNSYSFLGYAPAGVPHKAQGIDVVRQFFPWKNFSVEMLKRGEIPLWNPYNFSGNPHLANFQTGVFYPLNIIFLLLPLNLAWTIFIIFQPFLACCFTYLLARELKISRLGSLFASIAFAFCLYFTVWIEYGNVGHAILWLPIALFLVEKIIKKLEWRWIVFLVLALTLSILAGYIQATIYLFGIVFFYFFFRILTEKVENSFYKVVAFLASGALAFLISAIQLLPTLEIFLQSARQAYPPEKIPELLLPWFYPITTFVSDFFGNPASRNYWYPGTYIERVSYIGVLPLFFAFLAIFGRRKEKIVTFFTVLAIFSLIFSLNLFPVRFFYGLKIPIISTTVYTRLLSVFSFAMAVLAGFGVDWCFKNKQTRKILAGGVVFVGVYVCLWLFTFLAPLIFPQGWWISHLKISQRNLILPTAFAFLGTMMFIFSSWQKKQSIILSGIILITIFDLFFYFKKITPFSPKEFVYPETPIMRFLQEQASINRFWGYGIGYIDSNFSTFTGTYSIDGCDPLFIRRYGELISASDNGKIKDPIPRSDVVLTKGYGKEALRENPYRQRLLDLLGVRYVLQKDEGLSEVWQPDYQTFPPKIYKLIWQKGKWQVYENKKALPRIFLAGDYQVEKDNQKIADLIFNPDFALEKKLILEEELGDNFALDSQAFGEVELINYQPRKIEVETNSLGNKLLFISDNYFPGWKAFIDDQPSAIYRADYAFRAILVPKGEHKIIFSYKPESFKFGTIISGIGVVGLLILSFFTRWRTNR